MLVGRMAGFSLTALGRIQAERLAHHLALAPIRQVLSSPLERARETAAPLAREKGLAVDISTSITEIDSGAWTGNTFSELDRLDPWRQFNRFRSATVIPGGESMTAVQARFVGEMLRLRDAFPDTALALVSHADPIKIALAYFLGTPLDFYDRLEIGLGSVSVISLDGWCAKVLRLNDVPRLER